MNFDARTATLETPIAAYGVRDVSRPVAAALLGLSVKAISKAIAEDRIEATGRCHQRLALCQIEAVSGRPVSVHDYLAAITRTRGRELGGPRAPTEELRASAHHDAYCPD